MLESSRWKRSEFLTGQRVIWGDRRDGTVSAEVIVAVCWVCAARVPLGWLPAGWMQSRAYQTKPCFFHACYVKHCPPELSALFWAAKDTFQLHRDTRLQPALNGRQSWECTGMLPPLSLLSRFRIKKLNPPLPFLAAAQPSCCAPPVAFAGQGRTACVPA